MMRYYRKLLEFHIRQCISEQRIENFEISMSFFVYIFYGVYPFDLINAIARFLEHSLNTLFGEKP